MKNEVIGSLVGKHDFQLQKEMQEFFAANGLVNDVFPAMKNTCYSSFERRRGRVGIVADSNQIEKAKAVFLQKHPDFVFDYINPTIGNTHFEYFRQITQ